MSKPISRLITSALAVSLGATSLSLVPVRPASAQEEPGAPIIPVNTPVRNAGPVINANDFTVIEGSRGEREITLSDPDGDAIKQVYWNPVDGFELEYVNDTTWKLIARETLAHGAYKIDVQAEDAHGNFGQVKSITVKVAKRPHIDPTPPPARTQGPIVTVQGGTFDNRQAHSIPFTVDDPQGDHIYQVWWYPIPGATLRFVEDNRWEIALAPGAKVGEHDLRIWAFDIHGNKGPEAKVKVNIVDGNPRPQPDPVPDPNPGVNNGPVVQVSGGTYDNRQRNVIPFRVVDPEGDWVGRVWWYPLPNSSLRHVEGNNWEIVMEPGVRPGDYPLRLWAMDDKGNKGDETKVNIRVVGNPVNAAPTINDGRISMWAGYPYTYKVPVTDPDNDPITLRIVDGEPWMSIVDGNKLRLAPGRHNVGHFRVTLEASDGKATDRGTYDVYVNRFN